MLGFLKQNWSLWDRVRSFKVHLWCIQRVGLWPPQDADQETLKLYTVYGWGFRVFFIHLFAVTQILYFKDVRGVNGIADALYLLMTQLTLIYKLEKFRRNLPRIQRCMRKLNCALYHPKSDEEAKPVLAAINEVFWMDVILKAISAVTISTWVVAPFFSEKRRPPLPAWFPFDYENSLLIFVLIYFYQIIGITISAYTNFSTDNVFSGLMIHVNGQILRLGCKLSKLGQRQKLSPDATPLVAPMDEELTEVQSKIAELAQGNSRDYGEVIECVMLYQDILDYIAEIEDIFRNSVLAQICASVIIICMTLLRMMSNELTMSTMSSAIGYLLVMISQISVFCYVGNEVTYSTDKLSEVYGQSNYPDLDLVSSKASIMFLQRTMRQVFVKAGSIFKVTLDLNTLVQILKLSYSYVAVLQSIQTK